MKFEITGEVTRFITRSSASSTVTARPFAARDRRDLEADIAAADDHDVLCGIERPAQAAHVVDLAQREHAGKLDAGQRNGARARAGRQEQRAVVGVAARDR